MTARSSTTLRSNINSDIADNNAGDITAQDVRTNLIDMVDSVKNIMTTELLSTEYFQTDVYVGNVAAQNESKLHITYGIQFSGGSIQTEAYPGPGSIDHGQLDAASLGDDDHPQYFPVNASRAITGDVQINDQWISSSGTTNRGMKFVQDSDQNEEITLGNNTSFKFSNGSELASAMGVAKAWINFSASGASDPVTVNSAYNIVSISRDSSSAGKFTIAFKDGTFKDTNYVAIANSNGRNDGDTADDFSINTVGLVIRNGAGTSLDPHKISYRVMSSDSLDTSGSTPGFVDAPVNNLVVFGLGSGVTGDDPTAVTVNN